MKYIPNFSLWSPVFAVPSSIIDNHIKLLSGVALKAMLLILRHNGEITADEIASLLSQSVGDVNDALSELIRSELIVSSDCEERGSVKAKVTVMPTKPLEESQEPEPKLDKARAKIVLTKPTLTRSETHALIADDKNLEYLIQEAQTIKGDTLSSSEMSTLVSLCSYYGLACDFILMVMQYCRSINKFSMGYIEKTIASWVDMGIDNHEKAEQHIVRLSENKRYENQIRSAFGIGERALGDKERAFIRNWFEMLGYDISMIKFAFERTIENTGKLSFAYINKILISWHEKGFKTPKEASLEQKKSETSEIIINSPKHAPSRKASYDISNLEKMIYSGYDKGENK